MKIEVQNSGKKDWMVKESQLDDDQYRVLNAINDKSLIVSGSAGSGKSVLALIKAKRIQNEKGNNYKIIVFTKALCKYMNTGKNALGLNNDFYYHWDWKNRLHMPSADYIIVDEIQDFTKEEIQEFISATNKNFFFFGDSAQSIFDGIKDTLPVEGISRLLPPDKSVKFFDLYKNYRLPKPVAKIVQYIGIGLDGFDIETYRSPETSIPRFIQYSNYEEQINAISRIIKIPSNNDVGILVPHNGDVKTIHNSLQSLNINHEIRYTEKSDWKNSIDTLNFNTSNPKVMTYHSAKGLQFGTVILPNIQPILSREREISDRKALYVAMTRTYKNLYVLYSGNLPYPLDRVPKEIYKTSEKDTVEDI